MSAGCAIVASDTQPLKEAIVHEETGLLIDFFDPQALVQSVVKLLESPSDRQRLSDNARKFAQTHYDLQKVCLPRQIEWVTSLTHEAI